MHLVEAIEHGLVHAIGLVGEACSARDLHRRAAPDEGYAEAHPIAPAKERQDPTERLRGKVAAGRRGRERTSATAALPAAGAGRARPGGR